MRAAVQERIQKLRAALTKDHLAFIRVAGVRHEYAVRDMRHLQHNLEFILAGETVQRLVIEPDDLCAIRTLEP